jgi:hypothetical protein
VGRTLLSRLTRPQFDNTVHELLGNTNNPSSVIAPDERIGPFYSNGIAPVTNLIVQQHSEVAATLAASAVARMDQIAGCKLSTDTGTACAAQFINDFGLRVYRRPLEQAEKDKYLSLYAKDRDPRLFMGTTFPWNAWVVIGVFYPPKQFQGTLDFGA